MGVWPRFEFDNIMFINCLVNFIFMVHLRFYAIPLLIYGQFYIYGAFEILCNSIAYL